MLISRYLPQDRLGALARGESLPDRTSGTALFADISGFTALTEALRESLGSRRGGEELTKHLDDVYTALIVEIEKHGGSVIDFAGDAVMCWFDEALGSPSSLAVTCAFAMQQAMQAFSSIASPNDKTAALSLKVAITTGPTRRFVVGDPTVHLIDALAGATISRTSTAEQLAQRGEVILDEATINVLGEALTIKEWREDHGADERFAVVTKFVGEASTPKLPALLRMPAENELRPWLHQPVYARELAGQATFQAEFRPCVALFVRFGGIDFEAPDAQAQLDAFIRNAQSTVKRYEGTLLQVTVGDKGSYTYINFGVLNAHEDDAHRAVKAALELRNSTELHLQMGITQGLMRVGAYGGATRKAFGALGDDVNLAARLMVTASDREILLSSHVYEAVRNHFTFEPRPPLPMKGKAEPLSVFAVTGERRQRAIRLQEPTYALPLVGRTQELQIITEKLDLAAQGRSQVVAVVAEAGLGKSRLVAEVIRSARRKGFVGYGGACQSDGIHTPYMAWKGICQAFFDVDPDLPLRKLLRNIEGEIEDRAPSRVKAIPLLNVVLGLQIPENEFTRRLEPKIRQSALHALLEDCLKSAAAGEPLLIVIEDVHWIDAQSHDLLEQVARALANYAVCFVLVYRPHQMERLRAPRLEALPQFTRIDLHELTKGEAESAIRAKLAQLYPARSGALPIGLVETLMGRSQGNPFFLEELLNYVRDRGLDPAELNRIELPDSLHTLILSRIDRLSDHEKTTLRAASIVGRRFRARWLTGYYPDLGSYHQVNAALDALVALDLLHLDSPDPELAYLFKHIVTHEVTYESLLFATRARLHEQLARYLERVDESVDSIAFHYGRSENREKQLEYLRKAGEAAQGNFANDAALAHYGALLPLLEHAGERTQIHLRRGQVFELIGNYDDAETDYHSALELAKDDLALQARAQFALAKLDRKRGNYTPALNWLVGAREARTALEDVVGLAEVLIETGTVLGRKGDYKQAREALDEGLALVRDVGDMLETALALNELGTVTYLQSSNTAARAFYEESLALRRVMGDKAGIAASLNSLGGVAAEQGDQATARALFEESLVVRREMGDKAGISASLNNLGNVARAQGDSAAARTLYEESLALSREMGDKWGTALSLVNLGLIVLADGDHYATRAFWQESLAIRREIGDKRGSAASLINLGNLALIQGNTATARASFDESLALCEEIDEKLIMAGALLALGMVDLAEDSPAAREHILRSLRLRRETGEKMGQISRLIAVAGLALQEGKPYFATQWLGAVESSLRALNAVMEPEMFDLHAQTLTAVREQLDESAFRQAWEEGSQWSLEDAVQRALEERS
jgi:class 3 adenylate cyclase/tetratricopeptide (TPR) repeat protein